MPKRITLEAGDPEEMRLVQTWMPRWLKNVCIEESNKASEFLGPWLCETVYAAVVAKRAAGAASKKNGVSVGGAGPSNVQRARKRTTVAGKR
jgi:hypothetical protein